MEENNDQNGAEASNATALGGADATAEEIRKARELLRANGYGLVAYREVGEKVKRIVDSGLDFVKGKCKALGGWFSTKRAELKARQEERSRVAAEKRRLAEETETRRAEAESGRTITKRQSAGSGDVSKCAACGAVLVPGARFCRKCGKPVSAVQDTPTAEPTAEAKSVSASDEDPVGSAVVKCAACGAALVPAVRFCRKCAKPVSAVRDTPTAGPTAEAKSVSASDEDSVESAGPKCAACGAALATGMKFCGECGTPENAEARNPRKRKRSSPRKNTRKVAK